MAAKKRALRPARKLRGSDWLWTVIRQKRQFTADDLKMETKVDPSTIKSFMDKLVKGGFILATPNSDPITYDLVNDIGVDRPRIREDGSEVGETGQERMWRQMKMAKGDFTWRDLARLPGIGEQSAKHYVGKLAKAGVLIITQSARPGELARYMLLSKHNTGPRPPQIKRDAGKKVISIYDPNTGTTYPIAVRAATATCVAKCRLAWGGKPPEWVLVLAAECDASSQRAVAKRISCGATTVNQVVRNRYGGDLGRIAKKVVLS